MGTSQAELEPEILHTEALRGRLADAGFPVYTDPDGIPAEPGWPYYVLWAAAGEPLAADERMRGYSGVILTRHQVTIAALTAFDCVGAAARARNLLHRWQPDITGRRAGDVSHDPGGNTVPTIDLSVTGPLGQRIYLVFQYFTLASDLDLAFITD